MSLPPLPEAEKSKNRGQTALFAPDSCVFSNGCEARKRCLARVFDFFTASDTDAWGYYAGREPPLITFSITSANVSISSSVVYTFGVMRSPWYSPGVTT